jgi:hypothetical protein
MGATLTTAYLLASDFVPEDHTTVGFSLLTLALNAGAAAGYALGGQLAAHGSPADGFLLAAGAALLAAFGAASLAGTAAPRGGGSARLISTQHDRPPAARGHPSAPNGIQQRTTPASRAPRCRSTRSLGGDASEASDCADTRTRRVIGAELPASDASLAKLRPARSPGPDLLRYPRGTLSLERVTPGPA